MDLPPISPFSRFALFFLAGAVVLALVMLWGARQLPPPIARTHQAIPTPKSADKPWK